MSKPAFDMDFQEGKAFYGDLRLPASLWSARAPVFCDEDPRSSSSEVVIQCWRTELSEACQ